MTTGQNDALGEFFYIFIVFFFVFNDLHRYYGFSRGMVWFNTGNNNNNGPKRHVLCRLALR